MIDVAEPGAPRLVAFVREQRFRIIAIAIVLAVIYAAKRYYSTASAGDLAWLLSPTSSLVSLVTGFDFSYEAGTGWVSREAMFIIAPACSGVNFAMAAFLALSLGWLGRIERARDIATRLGLAVCIALVATLVINTVRIVIAIAMHRGTLDVGSYDRAELHRIEGIVVYLGGLCALYALTHKRKSHALAR